MNLDDLKEKFRNKASAGLKDIDIALKATPFLVREVCRLESELENAEKRIRYLNSLINKRPLLEKSGTRGPAQWNVRFDEKKNILFTTMLGKFDGKSAKLASNAVITVLENMQKNFDVINDLSKVVYVDKKALFHFRKVQYTLLHMDVRLMIRVVPPEGSPIGKILGARKGISKDVQFVGTFEEAEQYIDNYGKFLKT